jgi:hypothetical protein
MAVRTAGSAPQSMPTAAGAQTPRRKQPSCESTQCRAHLDGLPMQTRAVVLGPMLTVQNRLSRRRAGSHAQRGASSSSLRSPARARRCQTPTSAPACHVQMHAARCSLLSRGCALLPSLKPIGCMWSYLACRKGHWVPIPGAEVPRSPHAPWQGRRLSTLKGAHAGQTLITFRGRKGAVLAPLPCCNQEPNQRHPSPVLLKALGHSCPIRHAE